MGGLIKVTDRTFSKEVLKSKSPVLVDFWSPTCVPCKRLAPILDKLSEEFSEELKFVKMNVTDETRVSSEFGVMGLPTVMFFNKGRKVEELVGASGEKRMRRKIENVVASLQATILKKQRTREVKFKKYGDIGGLQNWIVDSKPTK
ncbi:MAG: thioredoxin [Candidatus Diapherotrites archaeon]|nr:thioredoxin [Candidatus Diapherotrites archaeon]